MKTKTRNHSSHLHFCFLIFIYFWISLKMSWVLLLRGFVFNLLFIYLDFGDCVCLGWLEDLFARRPLESPHSKIAIQPPLEFRRPLNSHFNAVPLELTEHGRSRLLVVCVCYMFSFSRFNHASQTTLSGIEMKCEQSNCCTTTYMRINVYQLLDAYP